MLSWGNQKAIETRTKAMVILVKRATMRFIILFWIIPELSDWKSGVLINTKRI